MQSGFDSPSEDLVRVHDARNALAVASGQLRLIRDRIDRGDIDCARLLDDLTAVDAEVGRAAALVEEIGDERASPPGPA
jgi:hypothetical protein